MFTECKQIVCIDIVHANRGSCSLGLYGTVWRFKYCLQLHVRLNPWLVQVDTDGVWYGSNPQWSINASVNR